MNTSRGGCAGHLAPTLHCPTIYIAAEILIAVLSTAGNALVCLAVFRNRKLRTVTNYFLVSLAVADAFVGVLAIPCAVLTGLGLPHHNLPLCLVLLSLLIVLTQSSILSLLAVAAERYVAILLPLQYRRIASPRNARLALLVTWALALLTGSVPLMGWHGWLPPSGYCIFTCVVDLSYMVYFNFFGCVLAPLVVMFVIYGHIFLTVRQQLRRIADGRARPRPGAELTTVDASTEDTRVVGEGGGGGGTTGADAGARDRAAEGEGGGVSRQGAAPPAKRAHRMHGDVRKATSLFLVLFLFMLCWLPLHCVNCVALLCPHCRVPLSVTLTAILLSHANSALNPLLYAYRMRSFRRTLGGLCRCQRCRRKAGDGRTRPERS